MGLMDKLLGRGKQVAGKAADKSKDLAEDAFDKSKHVAGAGLGKAGEAMMSAGDKLAGQDETPERGDAPAAGEAADSPADGEASES